MFKRKKHRAAPEKPAAVPQEEPVVEEIDDDEEWHGEDWLEEEVEAEPDGIEEEGKSPPKRVRKLFFRVQMAYEREDIGALVRTLEYRRQPEKNLRIALKVGYPIFGILLLFGAVWLVLKMVEWDAPTIPGILVGVLITLGMLLGGIALIRRSNTRGMERRSWKKYPNKGVVLTYSFYDDGFVEEDEVAGHNEYRYLFVKNGNLDANHFYLFNENNAAHMLRKDSFQYGDPEKFTKFIRAKAAVRLDPVDDDGEV